MIYKRTYLIIIISESYITIINILQYLCQTKMLIIVRNAGFENTLLKFFLIMRPIFSFWDLLFLSRTKDGLLLSCIPIKKRDRR